MSITLQKFKNQSMCYAQVSSIQILSLSFG